MEKPAASIGTVDLSTGDAESTAIVERIKWCVERIRLGFDQWDEPYVHGPGLYVVVERDSATGFAEPMGANSWPVEDCGTVFSPRDALVDTAREVAFTCDGAVIVHSDGEIKEELVRITQLSTAEQGQFDGLPYAGWMGTRHMSALETSTRPEVFAAITLSEEDGRVTIFTDGTFKDYPRDPAGTE